MDDDDQLKAGRVEDGRGSLGHAATPRFSSSLIEPDVPISGFGSPTDFTVKLSAAAQGGRSATAGAEAAKDELPARTTHSLCAISGHALVFRRVLLEVLPPSGRPVSVHARDR